MLVSCLPFSAANGALGEIAGATGAQTADLQWVTDAFAVALGATVLSAGVLGDLYGRRRTAVSGLGLTVVGSAGESSAPDGRRLDVPGQVSGSVGIAALTFAVISGGSAGWTSALTVVAFVVAAAGLVAFALVERRSAAPLFSPTLFAARGFTAAGLGASAVLFAMGGGAFVLSLFFARQQVGAPSIAVRRSAPPCSACS
jgi:MFS family permease